jgi:hypothetical protein
MPDYLGAIRRGFSIQCTATHLSDYNDTKAEL